ncbi:MAG: PBECR2 nuclease fold domain-containing protein, partial [Muribaculaceae bacterium]|nr:PBECR2 nuclease fold domain-containing protein [Muribaculaceae bacterium]
MRIIGKIDIEKYRCVSDNIITDEVIITENQISHIKEHHPNDYEQFSQYLGEIVADPDYIIEGNRPDSALILKEICQNGKLFKTVLKIATVSENPNYQNSIITFMKIDEKEWN